MKKILLIEDRVERQERFSKDTGIRLDQYSAFLDNQTEINLSNLDQYSTIIVHRSAFGDREDNVLDLLKEHCTGNKTQLVFFSGGITSTYYSKSKYEFLLLNSKSFYSDNLKVFLEHIKEKEYPNLLLLGYGKNWKVNLMLNTLEDINLFIADNLDEEMVEFELFKTYTKIENIRDHIKFEYPEVKKGGVYVSDLHVLSSNIKYKIRREVELHA